MNYSEGDMRGIHLLRNPRARPRLAQNYFQYLAWWVVC